jgi:Ni/Co efflux regulator RcnB
MKRTHPLYKFSVAALAPVLALAVGASAYAQDHDRDNHQSGQRDDRNYQGNDNQRSTQGNYQQRNDDHHSSQGNAYGRNDDRHYNQGNGHDRDFHFDNSHRDRFEQHYRRDADRWRDRHDRARFAPGRRIPTGYRIQPVPYTYYRGAPPPPRGYRYGYYEGYVVAYDPTTRVIGDVLDLIGAAASSH